MKNGFPDNARHLMQGADAEQVRSVEGSEDVFDPIKALKGMGIAGLPEEISLEEEDDTGESFRATTSYHPGDVLTAENGVTTDPYAEERERQSKLDGAMRFNKGKLRYDLLPPEGIEELVGIYTMGAEKYAPRNWEKGLSLMDCFASMLRHAFAWARGQDLDEESGRPHMAHVAWNAIAIVTLSRRGTGTDDRPTI